MKSNRNKLLETLELDPFPQPPVINLNYPVLLCHGYGAIASLIKPSPLHDVCMLLRRHGIMAFAPNVEPYARIESRARSWQNLIHEILERTHAEKLNVIAHSMGGLDIRYAISALGADNEIASLTTLATPHRGTALADLALQTPSSIRSRIGAFFDWIGDYVYPGSETDFLGPLQQLTRSYMNETFNAEYPNHINVAYYSYSSAIGKGTQSPVSNLLRFQNRYIFDREGVNDGFVSVQSAQWGEHQNTFSLSHLEHMKLGISDNRVSLWKECWLQMTRKLSEQGY